jgi:hypothetical protein
MFCAVIKNSSSAEAWHKYHACQYSASRMESGVETSHPPVLGYTGMWRFEWAPLLEVPYLVHRFLNSTGTSPCFSSSL